MCVRVCVCVCVCVCVAAHEFSEYCLCVYRVTGMKENEYNSLWSIAPHQRTSNAKLCTNIDACLCERNVLATRGVKEAFPS